MMNLLRDLFNRVCPLHLRPVVLAGKKVQALSGDKVMHGPFKGMHYVGESVGSSYFPKIMGTYEKELHTLIEKICRRQFQSIVDVGAAEGYYAVGMAMRCPSAVVEAFEAQAKGQELLVEMARLNCVEQRVIIHGHCEIAELRQAALPESLVIMDVEGAEEWLLDPKAIPNLEACFILVELHEYYQPGISGRLRQRFEASHHIETILQRKRRMGDIPLRSKFLRSGFVRSWFLKLAEESRGDKMSWYFMTPLAGK